MENTAVTFDVALQSIIDERNENVDQINDLITAVEDFEAQVEALTSDKKELETKLDNLPALQKELGNSIAKIKELSDNVVAQNSEINTLRKKEKDANRLARVAEKDLKKMSANKAKMLQSNKTLRKQVDRLTAELKERRAEVAQLDTVYKNNTHEYLIMHPTRQSLGAGTSGDGGNVVLLYTDRSGVYLSAALNHNHEAVFSSFLNADNTLSDRSKQMITNNCIKPSQAVIDYATQWLYRVNITQKAKVMPKDLVCKKEDVL